MYELTRNISCMYRFLWIPALLGDLIQHSNIGNRLHSLSQAKVHHPRMYACMHVCTYECMECSPCPEYDLSLILPSQVLLEAFLEYCRSYKITVEVKNCQVDCTIAQVGVTAMDSSPFLVQDPPLLEDPSVPPQLRVAMAARQAKLARHKKTKELEEKVKVVLQ